MRRRVGVPIAVSVLVLLAGCTHVVEDRTEQLKDELLGFDIVEGGFASTGEGSVFDEAFSAISLDVAADARPDQLDDLVTYWRFGVDDIDARWHLGLTKPGDEQNQHFDSFDVAGVRSVADLSTLVRFWHGLGPVTQSADISVNDYDSTGESDGSMQLQLGALESAGVQDLMLDLQQQAFQLPGRFQWIVDAGIPAGTLSVASTNVLPDPRMLDLLETIAAPPSAGAVGEIFFWGIESTDPFQAGQPQRLAIDVYLEPPSIPDLGGNTQGAWDELGDRVLADPDVWPVIQEIADRLPRDEATVTLSFYVHGDQLAHLDPLECSGEGSEQVYGPLNRDLWSVWSPDECLPGR
jgi:hypothetical protein